MPALIGSHAVVAFYCVQVILVENLWKPLPYIATGSLALLAAFLSLWLPETRNRRLPQSLEEGERFARGENLEDSPAKSQV